MIFIKERTFRYFPSTGNHILSVQRVGKRSSRTPGQPFMMHGETIKPFLFHFLVHVSQTNSGLWATFRFPSPTPRWLSAMLKQFRRTWVLSSSSPSAASFLPLNGMLEDPWRPLDSSSSSYIQWNYVTGHRTPWLITWIYNYLSDIREK